MLQQTNDRSLYSFKSRFHCNNKKYVPESVRIQAIDRGTGRAKGGSCPHPTFSCAYIYFYCYFFHLCFKFWLLFVCKIEKRLSASGGLRPLTPTRGSAPGPCWGLCPQTPIIGSRSALAMACPPTFKHLPRSLIQALTKSTPVSFVMP